MARYFLAFDLGASSGRAILGTLDADKLTLEELHRFENGGVEINGGWFWNLLGLFTEMKTGLRLALARGVPLSGIAIDTWGVDFALLNEQGQFAGFPRMYRDPRNSDVMKYVLKRIPAEDLYGRTGIQFMNFNSLFQLAAMKRDRDPALRVADKLLFIPNALSYLFCGVANAEYTIATTSQAYNPITKDWDWASIEALKLPRDIFPPIVPPCSVVGQLRPAVCEELCCKPLPVILIGSHDTASAVAAVPSRSTTGNWAYLSSGTWSLLGMELDQPLISADAQKLNYTNEGGVGGKIRFLKNIMGLWLVQESRNTWRRQGKEYSFPELGKLAAEAAPFKALINPNDDLFLTPGDMPARIQDYCRKTQQTVPETPGEIIRCALESLALRYRQTIEELEQLTGKSIELLHLVGGGSQDRLLNQFTADAIKRPVVAGPVEATAIGNLLGQAMAVGAVKDLDAARQVVCNSFETSRYQPEHAASWDAAYERYRKLPGIA